MQGESEVCAWLSVWDRRAKEDVDAGRLAGAIGAEQADDGPARDRERHAVERAQAAEVFDEVMDFEDEVGHSLTLTGASRACSPIRLNSCQEAQVKFR